MIMKFYEGSNDNKILRFCYPRKVDETMNPMKPKSNGLELRLERNYCFKISKNPHSIWAKMKNNSIDRMKLTT